MSKESWLPTDEEIEHIIATTLSDNPHWQPDAWGLYSAVAKAQARKIAERGDENCNNAEHHIERMVLRRYCLICWQSLLQEIEES